MKTPTLITPTAVEILPASVTSADPAWHEAHRGGVSATDVAKVLGLSTWGDARSVWERKTGSATDDAEPSESMRWGSLLEPVICGRFADLHPDLEVRDCGILANTSEPWMLATPDRLVGDGLLEVKTTGSNTGRVWGRRGSDQIPHAYWLQVQWQMAVTGCTTTHVAVLIGGQDYREYTVAADDAVQAYLCKQMADFWRHVLDNTAPGVDR